MMSRARRNTRHACQSVRGFRLLKRGFVGDDSAKEMKKNEGDEGGNDSSREKEKAETQS